jgi:hypothetical protein
LKDIIEGREYGQTITGTIFRYRVLKEQGEFQGKKSYLVENIETHFRQVICETELHEL